MLEYACEAILSWAFVCWEIFNQSFNIIVWLISSWVLFLPSSVLKGYTFLRIRPFLLCCPFYCHIVVCSGFLWFLHFCSISCNFFFISNFIDFRPLLFLDESGQRLINFIYLLNESISSFIDLCYCFHLYFIYFCSDIYDLFPSTNIGFPFVFFL